MDALDEEARGCGGVCGRRDEDGELGIRRESSLHSELDCANDMRMLK